MVERVKLDVSLREARGVETKPVISEAFRLGGVPYYTEIPNPPESTPRQTILPLDIPEFKDWVGDYINAFNAEEPDPKKYKKLAWTAEEEALKNAGIGSFRHAAVVEYDEEGNITKYLYDLVLWNDGAIDARTGLSTPGAVVVPIEKVGDEYFVHCFWQFRPAPWDDEIKVPEDITDPAKVEEYIALNRGMWFLTTPGGFANFAGERPEDVARREAMEEAGLRITAPSFDKKSFNRANIGTLVRVGYSVFERTDRPELADEAEKTLGKMAIRIDKFRTTDAIVGEALQFARENLGLISASSLKS